MNPDIPDDLKTELYGVADRDNLDAHRELLREKGLSEAAIDNRYRLFCSTEVIAGGKG